MHPVAIAVHSIKTHRRYISNITYGLYTMQIHSIQCVCVVSIKRIADTAEEDTVTNQL